MNETELLNTMEIDYGKDLMNRLETGDISGFIDSCGAIYAQMLGRITVQEMITMGQINLKDPLTRKRIDDFLNETESLEMIIPQSMREDVKRELKNKTLNLIPKK